MKTRIALGMLMIAATAGVLCLDWGIDQAVHQGHTWAARVPPATPVAVLVLVLTGLAFFELQRLAAANQVTVLGTSGLCGTVLFALAPFWCPKVVLPWDGQIATALLGLIVAAVFAEQMLRRRTADAFRTVAATLLAVAYLGVGGAMILNIRYNYGTAVLVVFLAAVKFTDVGAYFTGSAVGRHKMAPSISPGKSWEGLVGGVAVGAGVAALTAWILPAAAWVPAAGMRLLPAAVFGALVGLVGQFADLCESALKRSAGAKDSGKAVPGFGGVLDIVDSPLLAAPAAWLLLQFIQ